jgi:hypothetical protein
MSNQGQGEGRFSSSSYSSYTSSSYSTSSGTDPQSHSKTTTETASSNDRDGTKIHRMTEETGKPTLQDEIFIPPGRVGLTDGGGETGGGRGRIEDVSDRDGDEEQAQRDREYEERIEEEYAKREGGA